MLLAAHDSLRDLYEVPHDKWDPDKDHREEKEDSCDEELRDPCGVVKRGAESFANVVHGVSSMRILEQ
jgi:hypothetical protein